MKPAQLGICATVGALRVCVYKNPRVGLISTGNEVCKADEQEKLSAGKIRDSNKPLLQSALKSFGLNEVFDGGIASDDCDSLLRVFKNAIKHCDVVISTGGVSMGDKVFIRTIQTLCYSSFNLSFFVMLRISLKMYSKKILILRFILLV